MNTDRIIYSPPECSRHCIDPYCPYPHRETWVVNGQHYTNLLDATAASEALDKEQMK